MQIRRFIVRGTRLREGRLAVHDRELAHRIRNVLRLEPGSEVILSDGDGDEARATIAEILKDIVAFEIHAVSSGADEAASRVTLCVALLKRENFELVLEKATEAGAREIIPVVGERTVKLGFRRERLEKIIQEAAEQSGRSILPRLFDPEPLASALARTRGCAERFFFHPGALPFDACGGGSARGARTHMSIFVGPEGGWSEAEVELARAEGCTLVGLGALTLRAETAATVATFLAAHRGEGRRRA